MIVEKGIHYPFRFDSLPAGWRAGYLGGFTRTIMPGFASGEHNQTGIGIPHLRPMNINRDGKIDLSTIKYVAGNKDSRRLSVGDVLFNNTNNLKSAEGFRHAILQRSFCERIIGNE